MNFLNPLFLFGLGAAAIPVLIHLFTRRKPREVRFPSLDFLAEVNQSEIRRLRIKQWLLLLLRTLAVALLGAGAVAPVVTGRHARRHGGQHVDRAGGRVRQHGRAGWRGPPAHRHRPPRGREPARHARPRRRAAARALRPHATAAVGAAHRRCRPLARGGAGAGAVGVRDRPRRGARTRRARAAELARVESRAVLGLRLPAHRLR